MCSEVFCGFFFFGWGEVWGGKGGFQIPEMKLRSCSCTDIDYEDSAIQSLTFLLEGFFCGLGIKS